MSPGRVDRGMATKLSPVQSEALRTLVVKYRQAVATEGALWGQKSANALAEKGVCVDGWNVAFPTWRALERAGLVTVRTRQTEHESLRRGAYGRWIGGSKTRTETSFTVRPTAAGLAQVGE